MVCRAATHSKMRLKVEEQQHPQQANNAATASFVRTLSPHRTATISRLVLLDAKFKPSRVNLLKSQLKQRPSASNFVTFEMEQQKKAEAQSLRVQRQQALLKAKLEEQKRKRIERQYRAALTREQKHREHEEQLKKLEAKETESQQKKQQDRRQQELVNQQKNQGAEVERRNEQDRIQREEQETRLLREEEDRRTQVVGLWNNALLQVSATASHNSTLNVTNDSVTNYGINDWQTDDETDDEQKPRKKISFWTQGVQLEAALHQQYFPWTPWRLTSANCLAYNECGLEYELLRLGSRY